MGEGLDDGEFLRLGEGTEEGVIESKEIDEF
jgi:hypothetical protein